MHYAETFIIPESVKNFTVRPLDDASLQALQQAGQLEEDGQYWFIYLYSSAQ